MCLGLPGRILAVSDAEQLLAIVETGGIQREISLACVTEGDPHQLIGRWVLIHVGFAMSIIDEQQALETLGALEQVQALMQEPMQEPMQEKDAFSQLQEKLGADSESGKGT